MVSHSVSQSVSPVTQSCPTLYNPMNHSTPGLPVHHQLLFTFCHKGGVICISEVIDIVYFFFLAALGFRCRSKAFSSHVDQGLFSSCGAQDSHCRGCTREVPVPQKLWSNLAAPRHVESSQTRDWTCVPCTSRWILNTEPPGKSQ